jgi:peptidoglycan hydrolase-like protein with peptidoglycan-binding domain
MHDILKRGAHGPQVKALQEQLNAVGCHCTVDGIFGENTEQAVRNFQKAFGLTADGEVGPHTHAKLAEAKGGNHNNS